MNHRYVVGLVILSIGLAAAAAVVSDTRAADCQSRFLSDVASLRSRSELSVLRIDQDRHDLIMLRLGEAAEQKGLDFFEGGQALGLLERLITDWDEWSFVVTGNDVAEVLDKIEGRREFAETVLRPDVTSIAVGAGRFGDDRIWCAGCIARRLVTIDRWLGDFSTMGPSLLTARGSSPYKNLRVRFYKGEQDPIEYTGEDREIDFETDAEGRFEVTIPISAFGPGDYRIVFYVLDPENGAPEIALFERSRVPGEPPMRVRR